MCAAGTGGGQPGLDPNGLVDEQRDCQFTGQNGFCFGKSRTTMVLFLLKQTSFGFHEKIVQWNLFLLIPVLSFLYNFTFYTAKPLIKRVFIGFLNNEKWKRNFWKHNNQVIQARSPKTKIKCSKFSIFLFCPNKNTFWTKNYLKMIFHRPVENRLVGWKSSIFFFLFSHELPIYNWILSITFTNTKTAPKPPRHNFGLMEPCRTSPESFSTASTATRFYAGLGCFTTNKRSLQPRKWDARWWRTSSPTKKHTKRMFGVNLKGAS